ncbi:MAG: alpha/beta hydrolase [Myxococcales bacterium FL481]|nr:MAG: alpha/beta hydrolase [Myxococcales bacterium FL481]
MKKLGIALGGVVVLIVAGIGLGWWWMGTPLYEPGSLADRTDLEPHGQREGRWQVTPDIELATFARGTGRNVLFVHGGPGAPPTGPIAAFERLSDDYRVHYYAQRGCGDSTRPIRRFESRNTWDNMQQLDQALGLGEQLADIERIRRLLGDERLIVIGHSYGALLAALYAAELPQRVEALVLISPADLLQLPPAHGGLFEAIRAQLEPSRHAAYDAWQERYLDFDTLFERTEDELAALDEELVAFWLEATGGDAPGGDGDRPHSGAWMARAQYISMGMRHDYRSALAAVTAPTLIIHGEKDLQPVAVSKDYQVALANASLVTVAQAGHFPHFSHPDEVAAAIRALFPGEGR